MNLTAAFWDYDRTTPILDGRIGIEGCTLACTVMRPQELFPRAFGQAEFDISELSLSRHAQALAEGRSRYTGIPAFLSRTFRHGSLYVRPGIETPQDLVGRRIGVNNYDDTAAVVVRGMLRDEYGLGVRDITWVVGDFDAPRRATIEPPALHTAIPVAALPPGRTLDAALVDGEIDGVIGLFPPPCFHCGTVRRLFVDWVGAERDYFARTRLFPIMHLVGVRTTLAEAHPWLPAAALDAFARAKDIAMAGLANMQAPKATLPWVVQAYEETCEVMGADFWPYGIGPNRAILATTLRHLAEDGLLCRTLRPEELFGDTLS